MAHLSDDVAAFVDGQLSPRAMRAAERHVLRCSACREAVAAQRQLKTRMQLSVRRPDVPASLLNALSSVPEATSPGTADVTGRRSWLARVRRSRAVGASIVLVGASLAVAATAYVVGARTADADPVAPRFDSYAADFAQGFTTARDTMTVAAMASLDESGWPCHEELAGTLELVDGRWHEGRDTIAVTYSDGTRRLRLYEQNGRLDDDAVDGFSHERWDGHWVWVRDGSPTIVTWDADGIVYTVVSDVDRATLVRAVRELPRASAPQGTVDRLEDGVDRMTAWISAA